MNRFSLTNRGGARRLSPQAFGLPSLPTSEPSNYRSFGLVNLRTIEPSEYRHVTTTMACDLLKRVCTSHGDSIHLVFDKYISPSIEDCKTKLRRSHTATAFVITGPIQLQRQTGTEQKIVCLRMSLLVL